MLLSRISKMFLSVKTARYNTFMFINNVSSCSSDIVGISEELSSSDYFLPHSVELTKKVPISVEEFKSLKKLQPSQPQNPQLLRVTFLGEPNVGKSTLTNNLVKWKVCAVSRKVHTTRKKASAILVEGNKQIVFLDTPGFVSHEQRKKHFLEPSFGMDPISSIRNSDLIAVVIDISNKYINNRIPSEILDVLNTFKDKKSILILNKIDAMKSKSRILSFTKILTRGIVGGNEISDMEQQLSSKDISIEKVIDISNKQQLQTEEISSDVEDLESNSKRGWTLFSKVFMVSALKNDGVDDLRQYLLNETRPHDWMYHDSTVTDQHPHEIALMTVREKLLEYLPQEIPYNLNLKIVKWELLSSGCPKIDIKITCPNSRHRSFVIGPGGRHISACAEKSRRAMREAFRKDVVLHLGVV